MRPLSEKRRPVATGRRFEFDQLGRQIVSEEYNASLGIASTLKTAIIGAYSYGEISDIAAIGLIRLFGLQAA